MHVILDFTRNYPVHVIISVYSLLHSVSLSIILARGCMRSLHRLNSSQATLFRWNFLLFIEKKD